MPWLWTDRVVGIINGSGHSAHDGVPGRIIRLKGCRDNCAAAAGSGRAEQASAADHSHQRGIRSPRNLGCEVLGGRRVGIGSEGSELDG